jgi:hypothetical protein
MKVNVGNILTQRTRLPPDWKHWSEKGSGGSFKRTEDIVPKPPCSRHSVLCGRQGQNHHRLPQLAVTGVGNWILF